MQENVNLNDHENVITHFLLKEETLCTRIIMIIIFARKATEAAIATTMTITGCMLASSGVAGKEKYIYSHIQYNAAIILCSLLS